MKTNFTKRIGKDKVFVGMILILIALMVEGLNENIVDMPWFLDVRLFIMCASVMLGLTTKEVHINEISKNRNK